MQLSNKAYDVLKWIAIYLLPALGTLYFTLGSIFSLPYTKEVVGVITAVGTCLAALLGISTYTYNKEKSDI